MGEITLSAAIMAHPSRKAQVKLIRSQLDRRVPVVWDKIGNRWDTGRRSMLAYDPACSHHVVIQDDVLVPRDLLAGLVKALAHVPADAPVCGYIGRLRPQRDKVLAVVTEARRQQASWITMHTLNWGPLICVPTAAIDEMIAYCDPLDVPNYDKRLSRYWELCRHTRVWYSWPCLVDHRDGPSLVPGRVGTDRATSSSRVAHNFPGEQWSALEQDWSGPVIHATADGKYRPMPVARTFPTDSGEVLVFENQYNKRRVKLPPGHPRIGDFQRDARWELVEVKA